MVFWTSGGRTDHQAVAPIIKHTLDRWWGFALPKAAGGSHRGKVGELSPIRPSLCPGSDVQVNYNVREQSTSRPSSRYKYLLWTDLQTKNRLPSLASRHC
jgi:hypothetical protein